MIESAKYRIIVATVIIVYTLIIGAIGPVASLNYHPNYDFLIFLDGFASGLLGVGIIKQHKNFKND
jgi:hypothetical protein